MDLETLRVLEFLQGISTRATYGAVAEYLHIGSAQSVSERLGRRCPLASWVVSSSKKKPTGYAESECHPDLYSKNEIIRTGADIALRMRLEERKKDT